MDGEPSALAGKFPVNEPPPVVVDFPEPWPGDFDDWKKAWHPLEPSPIVRWMREQAEARRQQREGGGSDLG